MSWATFFLPFQGLTLNGIFQAVLRDVLGKVSFQLVAVGAAVGVIVLRDSFVGPRQQNVSFEQTVFVELDQGCERGFERLDLAGLQILRGGFGDGAPGLWLFEQAVA